MVRPPNARRSTQLIVRIALASLMAWSAAGSLSATNGAGANAGGAGNDIGRFVVFSRDQTRVRANATIVSGDVGANERRFHAHAHESEDGGREDVTVRIGQRAELQQPGSRVVGSTVLLSSRSSVFDVVKNFLIKKPTATVLGSVAPTMTVPYLTMPAFPTVTPGTSSKSVARNQVLTLGPGSYGRVHVKNGATLTLTGGLYQIHALDVDAKGTVLFRAPTEIRVKTELATNAKVRLILDPGVAGLSASQVVIYVAGHDHSCLHDGDSDDDGDDAGRTVVHIGTSNVVQANIYAKNGTVWLRSKTIATGSFIGQHVRIGVDTTLTLASAFAPIIVPDSDQDGVPDASDVCPGADDRIQITSYRDLDGDTFGSSASSTVSCAVPSGYVSTGGDADDQNNTVFPGAPERCDDGLDNNQNGQVNEGCVQEPVGDANGFFPEIPYTPGQPAIQPVALPMVDAVTQAVVSGLNGPVGIAFGPAGVLFVTTYNDGKILTVDTSVSPAEVREFASGFQGPASFLLELDATLTGQVLLAERDQNRVVAFAVTNGVPGPAQELIGGISGAWGIVRRPDGRLLVGAEFGGGIYEVTEHVGAPATKVQVVFGLNGPLQMKLDPSGNLWVSDYFGSLVHTYDPNFVEIATLPGYARCGAVAFDAGGNLYSSNADTGEMFRTDALGQKTLYASGGGFIQEVAFGPDGKLYIADYNGRIYVATPTP